MKYLNLFIDESGQSNPKKQNTGVYILSGCLVDNKAKEFLKIRANQIKFKYWGRTDIVFHSREISRKENEYAIFKNPKIGSSFEKDLLQFLCQGNFRTFFILVDLNKARNQNWNEEKVYKETTQLMIKNFLLALLAIEKCKGRIVIESATAKKDLYFHRAASYYLSAGISIVKASCQQIQKLFTEISFVTKKNHDIEEQIADLLAYGARLKFERRKLKNSYEVGLLKIINSKLFIMHPNTGKKKKKYYSRINSYIIVP